jgi:MFS family permease
MIPPINIPSRLSPAPKLTWVFFFFFFFFVFRSFFLGYVSDMKGRRPIMLLGLAGNAITFVFACMNFDSFNFDPFFFVGFSSAAFGVSSNLAWALITRGLNGLINGNTGVVKSYVREITDDTNQARAYSIRSGTHMNVAVSNR